MEDIKKIKRGITKIYKKTVSNMKALGTYKTEFDASVKRYSELSYQFDRLNEKWYAEGCKITEEYTNKSGATNMRKTALYLALENLRSDLMDMENLFGLTPKGLKAIKSKGREKQSESKLDALLGSMSADD